MPTRSNLDMRKLRGPLDEAGDAVALALGNERPDLVLRVVLLIVLDRADGRAEIGHQLVVDLGAGIDAAGGGAILTGIVVAKGLEALDDRCDIGVVVDDDRSLAAQFEMGALHRLCGGLEDLLAGRDITRDRDHVDLGVVDQRVPNAVATAKDHVDHALGQNIGHHLGELQRGQRCLLGRLEDDGVAARDGRRQLPRHHHQRVVPRRDRGDDANGVATDHRGVTGEILAGHHAMHVADSACEEPPAIDDGRNLVVLDRIDRLAAVERLESRKGVGIVLDGLRNPEQVVRTLRRGGARPAGEGLFGRADRGIDLRIGGFGDRFDQPAGLGVEHLLGSLSARLKARADKHFGVHYFPPESGRGLSQSVKANASFWASSSVEKRPLACSVTQISSAG